MTPQRLSIVELVPDDSGDRIAVDVLSGDGPTLVFLHGMTSTRVGVKSDELLALAWRRGCGFARPDLRGHGDSDGALERVTMTDLVADIAAVVGHVGRSVLVGSSMGALAAAWFAAGSESPDVAALVLLCPAFGFFPEMSKATGPYEVRRGDGSTMLLDECVTRDARNYDESTLPHRIRVPLLVIQGADDETVPEALSDRFCREVPHRDKEYWRIEGGSHSLNEDVGMVVDRVEAFLTERGLL